MPSKDVVARVHVILANLSPTTTNYEGRFRQFARVFVMMAIINYEVIATVALSLINAVLGPFCHQPSIRRFLLISGILQRAAYVFTELYLTT